MKPNVYLVEYIHIKAYEKLEEIANITSNIEIADIAINRNINMDMKFLSNAKCLKLIIVHGTGMDGVDLSYAKSKGIKVVNTPHLNALSVAELNVSLLLQAARKVNACNKEIEKQIIDYSLLRGNEISNKTVGFIGLGNIAIKTANILHNGFNMNVIAYNRSDKNIDFIKQYSLDYVLKNSDFIILGLALNDETKYIINKESLSKINPNAYLINTCRGTLVNEHDLLIALKTRKIKGYASDVFENDPIRKTHPLLNENVIGLPHIGANTDEALYRVGMACIEHIVNFKF